MRIHTAIATTCLAGTAALGGCVDIPWTDDTFTLSNAASMRVEVEVYKGPLSKTLPVQWGELEGLVDTAVDSLANFGEVICQAIDSKTSNRSEEGSKSDSCWSGCESASAVAGSVSRNTGNVGDQILRRMYADVMCLTKEAEGLQHVVRRLHANAPGCHIDQAIALLDGPVNAPCPVSQARTENESAREKVVSHLKMARAAAAVTIEREKKVRQAASEAYKSVDNAREVTAAADKYVDRWILLANARATAITFEKRLIDLADRLDEFRDAIDEAIRHAKQVLAEESDQDANGLQDALVGFDGALQEVAKFAETTKRAELLGTMVFNEWRGALGKIDAPASGFVAKEAEKLPYVAAGSSSFEIAPSLESATRIVSDIAAEAGKMMRLTKAGAWVRRLTAAANEIESDRTIVADLRAGVVGIGNKVELLAAQLEMDHPLLRRALDELETAQAKTKETKELSSTTNTPWEDPSREHIVRRIGDLAVKLKSKAFYWTETHTALAPKDRTVRIAMAGFANLASELSNQLESRADALQWQLDEKIGADASSLPLSLYLRDAEPTDFVNLYTWNRAVEPALHTDWFWHPWNAFSSDETADRVRVIERLFADHNWGKVNTVYGSGLGDFAMALVKDEIGNWSLKSFESDPTKLVKAYTELTLTALTKARNSITTRKIPQPDLLRLTGNLAAGQIGTGAGPFDVFDTEHLHERVIGDLEGIRDSAVKTRDERTAKRDESVRKAVDSEAKARSAEARAEAAPLSPSPTTCVAAESCSVELSLANARKAETEALEAKISVRTVTQDPAKEAASTATVLAGKTVAHVRKAEAAAAAATAAAAAQPQEGEPSEQTKAATAANADEAAKEAHLLAEKAKAYAEAAREWAVHAGAIVERESAVAALNAHRAEVNARIRDVLNDYAAVIATLLESRTPSDSGPEMTDKAQTDADSER